MKRPKLTHVDDSGKLTMVDVSRKAETSRCAIARALLRCSPGTRDAILGGTLKKGEALAAARVAGVLAAKRTGELIPLCHPLALTDVQIGFERDKGGIAIEGVARTVGRTGVEMEAMVAVALAGLTLYDMAKAVERGMTLEQVRLVEKSGGKSGLWRRAGEADGANPAVSAPKRTRATRRRR
jgi:cyclic pyranopterin phosphate synthase